MRSPEFGMAPLAATAWRTASAPATAATLGTASSAPAGGFSSAFRQVQAEVQQVIERGWSDAGTGGLSAEGLARRAALTPAVDAAAGTNEAAGVSDSRQQAFLERIAPFAREAGQALGVSPDLVAAHAALESGWGQRPLRDAAGQDTHNLFGIKAQAGWRGASTDALTTEYEDGTALKTTERFRSYPDAGSAFRDYARLLRENPRYAGVLGTGTDAQAFAQGLARGGYATDPAYAAKLSRLASRIQSRD